MARTKSSESKSSENAEALPPSKKYEPTQEEQLVLNRHLERKKQHPAPAETYKITHDSSGNLKSIEINHPDPDVGRTLAMDALGTESRPLFDGLVAQLAAIGMSKSLELELNFALSIVKSIKPRDDVEAMLAAQMAAMHNAMMAAARRLATSATIEQQDSASRMLNQCARTFATQLEALKKYRSNGEQIVKVQHVNVGNGGQAVITDTMQTGGGGGMEKSSIDLMQRLTRARVAQQDRGDRASDAKRQQSGAGPHDTGSAPRRL
jgi:hypothetical protein